MNEKKIAVVTGANRGMGFETCRQLHEKGFHVLLTARNETLGKEAAQQLGVDFLQLDITDEKSISRFAGDVKNKFGRVDVLVSNAGVLRKDDRNILSATPEIVDNTFSTNVTGPLFLVQKLVPLFPAGGKIIFISSGGGSMTDPVAGWAPVYCISKTTLNALMRQLAAELESKKISVNSVCPGWVRTRMGGKSAPRTINQGVDTTVWLATEKNIPTGKFFRDRKPIPF